MALVVELNRLLSGFNVGSGGDGLEDQAIYGGADQDLAYEARHYELNIMRYN
jgi:hypothetical protein